MNAPSKHIPRRKDDRIILQFDYDCFYAQVHTNRNPSLRGLPLGIRQKNILATCNYEARRLGVRKLMLAHEAKRAVPDLVIVNGEDLTLFRDASKLLFKFLRGFSWNGKCERLGFDEVFMDVTDIIEYNLSCLNKANLAGSFFQLSSQDPLLGFPCNLTAISGCIEGDDPPLDYEDPLYLRLILGSHLARYLRLRLEEDFGYTSTCGISTNKLLSKLVGSKNKPQNQTTLLAFGPDAAISFVDGHKLRAIPGIGHKSAQIMQNQVTGEANEDDSHEFLSTITAVQAREHPNISPSSIEKLLAGPGAERGVGSRVWGLLHGVDHTEVKEANDVPSQISIEDTYKGLDNFKQITQELQKLSLSLIRRMRVDLLMTDSTTDTSGSERWIARPKIVRLSTRSWPPDGTRDNLNYSRISRSGPLPSFVFDLSTDMEPLAERLVSEALLPLLRRLHGDTNQKWNLQLINICVANMAVGAAEDKKGAGRDIANMFKTQDEALRPWRINSDAETGDSSHSGGPEASSQVDGDVGLNGWDAAGNPACKQCGAPVPAFAMPAHLRFHELEGKEQVPVMTEGDLNKGKGKDAL